MSKQLTPVDALKNSLTQLKPQFQAALPSHISPEKFQRVLLTAVSTTPALVEADRSSLFAACMRSAQDGLLPDGREAALVTFRSKNGMQVQYMPMINGILKKVRQSGELSTITSQLVYKNDSFKYWVDAEGEHISHEPNMFSDRGEVIGCYALAKTKDGSIYIEVMTKEQVMAVKNASKSKDFGPWAGDFHYEMWKKTVLRRLSKKLPMSTDIETEESYESVPAFIPPVVVEEQKDVTPKEVPTKLSQLIKEDNGEVSNTEDVI